MTPQFHQKPSPEIRGVSTKPPAPRVPPPRGQWGRSRPRQEIPLPPGGQPPEGDGLGAARHRTIEADASATSPAARRGDWLPAGVHPGRRWLRVPVPARVAVQWAAGASRSLWPRSLAPAPVASSLATGDQTERGRVRPIVQAPTRASSNAGRREKPWCSPRPSGRAFGRLGRAHGLAGFAPRGRFRAGQRARRKVDDGEQAAWPGPRDP